MIHIRYAHDGKTHHLHISGHAGYAPAGSDIVCAGVSALSFALLEQLRQAGAAVEEALCRRGELALRCGTGAQADSAFSMALAGYRIIAKAYPRYAEVDTCPHGADTRKGAGKEHEEHAQQHSGTAL